MSRCTAKLIAAYSDPFGDHADLCVPYGPARKTHKKVSHLRGVMTVGGHGAGFVTMAPTTCANVSVFATANAYNTLEFDTANVNLHKIWDPNLPAASEFNQSPNINKSRIVLAALRVRYIGREDERSGTMYPIAPVTRNALDAVGSYTTTDVVAADPRVASHPVSRQWKTVCVTGSEDHELELIGGANATVDNCYPFCSLVSPYNAAVGAPIAGIAVYSKIGAQFEWEYVCYCEYVGRSFNDDVTNTQSDSDGMSLFQQIKGAAHAAISAGREWGPSIRKGIEAATYIRENAVPITAFLRGGGTGMRTIEF